jgi:hypothetical protein
MRKIILTAWQGKTSLAKAFWGYFVLGQFVVALAIIVIFSPAALWGAKGVETISFITWPLYYAFLVWAMVSIWKCSPNTKRQLFTVAAKIFVVLYSLLWVVAFLQGRGYVA